VTCDDTPKRKRHDDTWCGKPDTRFYWNVFCNRRVDLKACKIYAVGQTGAFPNVSAFDQSEYSEVCDPCGKVARSKCTVSAVHIERPDLPLVSCGQTVTVKAGQCSLSIQIIDAGPAKWTGNLLDLHPEAARKLWNCLHPGRDFDCKHCAVDQAEVLVWVHL
jgi:hypothetical protein